MRVLGFDVFKASRSYAAFFSPKGGCQAEIIRRLLLAKTSVRIQAFAFTSKKIFDALVVCKQRKVDVQVLLDRDHVRPVVTPMCKSLQEAGITTLVDMKHSIAHNKIVIIDEKVLITGSYNFTEQAETSNAENMLVLTIPALIPLYLNNWNLHAKHSVNPASVPPLSTLEKLTYVRQIDTTENAHSA